MAKTLELNFEGQVGPAKISIRNAREDLTPAEIKDAMEKMIQSNAFESTKGDLVSVVSARVVERTTEDIELP